MARNQIPKQFNFRVEMQDSYDDEEFDSSVTQDYTVHLGHQCDAWYITTARDKADAIADLQRFIAAARDALRRLKELP